MNPNYQLIHAVIQLIEEFDSTIKGSKTLDEFRAWMCTGNNEGKNSEQEPNWVGKAVGRSPESVISTQLVHMNRYAKTYSKSAIYGSCFTTQDDFIYLINLNAFGEMTKTELIRKNIQEKPAGMQIINRLIDQGWVNQRDSEEDKRSKVITISATGKKALEAQMGKIRQASKLVTGKLTYHEKMQLIGLLTKLEDFHQPIFEEHIEPAELLNIAYQQHLNKD